METQVRAEPPRSNRRRRWIALAVGVAVPTLAVALWFSGSSYLQANLSSTTGVRLDSSVAGPPGNGSNSRSTNAAGGTAGTISSVSSSGFTIVTPTGGTVSVKTSTSTAYDKGASKSTQSAATKDKTVLVLGKVNSTTITATQVIVDPSINLKKASENVVGFKQGTQGSSKSVGQIPSDYKQGSGALVSGTKAKDAIEASLKSYAGGVVDRVVQLSNGDYEVHNIGTNWPHHVFLNKNFKVIGAND